MKNSDLRETASKIQKIIRGVIGVIGGATAVASLLLGLYAFFGLSSTLFGLLLIAGMVPMDVLLTVLAMKSVTVEYLGDDDEYEEEENNYNCELTLIDCNEKLLGKELGDNLDTNKEISSGIAPMVHLEVFDNNNIDRGYVRKRVMYPQSRQK